jgi:transcription-repair coupling factor (superfamily II helicase)
VTRSNTHGLYRPARRFSTTPAIAFARAKLPQLAETARIPSTRIQAILRDLQAGIHFFGIEFLLPAFVEGLEAISAHVDPDAVLIVVNPDAVIEAHSEFLEARRAEYVRELEMGELAFPIGELFLDDEVFAADLLGFRYRVDVGSALVDAATPSFAFPALDNAEVVRVRKASASEDGGLHGAIELIRSWRDYYGRVVFVGATVGAAERLARLLRSHHDHVEVLPAGASLFASASPPGDLFEVVVGPLREGFRSPARSLAVFTEGEVVGRTTRRAGREAMEEANAISSFRDLQSGDLLVHVDFGVGRYRGLERMDAGGAAGDFLAIEYADGDRLYLPVYRLGRVSKYVGSPGFTKLDKLGGTGWEKTKERVKRQLADVASELLRIQAERAQREGFAFSAPDDTYREFEAAFPYETTPHQQSAIDDAIADMMSDKPMDRLLCGDVGFGKTEVAIRAAFKAVLDHKQVAVLVPTTVLAEQHAKSFRDRFAGSAARVEVISRFRTAGEVRDILAEAAAGKVDVLIGTHRLLSDDVMWRSLGLLIIDEEHRFGVTHKEKLKLLRSTIDVLTMTATPIPRTLEMSLLGIRDLSVIMTPPPGRLAVRTHIAKFKEQIIREGILAELKRGGQVFFVHNRVDSIYGVAEELRKIVPEAQIAVAHAQMRDTDLEDVMHRFLSRGANILVTTTIIESGIDVSTANTIFINEAHRLGLAQLHQLRGRVGRSSERAYCYLLVPDPNRLTTEAKRRLEVVQEHAELGAGMQIAQQDLDMRGAGNILGRDQSGHIEAIGFELFSELLAEAVAELKGQPSSDHLEPEVKVPVAAYISDTYVDDVGQRLAFYKRFSLADTEEQLNDVFAELEDRYGKAPEPVEALRQVVLLKQTMKRVRATRLEAGPKSVVVALLPDTHLDPSRVMALIEANRGKYEFRPDMTLVRYLKGPESSDILGSALRVAREVATCIAGH